MAAKSEKQQMAAGAALAAKQGKRSKSRLLSRLPARKKKIYYSLHYREAKAADRKGKLEEIAWDNFKPVIVTYLAKELAEKTESPGSKTPETEAEKGVYVG